MVSCILFLCSRRLLSIGWSLPFSMPLSVLLASNVEMAPVIMWSERQKAKWYIERIFTCRIRFSSPVVFYSVRRVFFSSSFVFFFVVCFHCCCLLSTFIYFSHLNFTLCAPVSAVCILSISSNAKKNLSDGGKTRRRFFLRRFPTFFNFNIINFP